MVEESIGRPDPRKLNQEVLREYFDNPYIYTHHLGDANEFSITVDSLDRTILLKLLTTDPDEIAVYLRIFR